MQMLNLRTLALGLPLGVALSLCVACGGDDDGGSKNGNGGSGGTGGATGGSSSSGSGNKAGSSSSGGGTGSGVTLPDDKTLGGLTDSEAEQLCDDYEKFASSGSFAATQQEFSCLLSGVLSSALSGAETDAEMQAACKTTYDQCKKAPFEPEASECEKPDASCTATVAELKQCMEDSAKAFEDLVEQFPTCSELTLESEGPDLEEVMDPPSCVALREKCPGLETPSAATM
jgi:hypothetical protein